MTEDNAYGERHGDRAGEEYGPEPARQFDRPAPSLAYLCEDLGVRDGLIGELLQIAVTATLTGVTNNNDLLEILLRHGTSLVEVKSSINDPMFVQMELYQVYPGGREHTIRDAEVGSRDVEPVRKPNVMVTAGENDLIRLCPAHLDRTRGFPLRIGQLQEDAKLIQMIREGRHRS